MYMAPSWTLLCIAFELLGNDVTLLALVLRCESSFLWYLTNCGDFRWAVLMAVATIACEAGEMEQHAVMSQSVRRESISACR